MNQPGQRPIRPWCAAALAAAISLAISLPLILSGRIPQRAAFDTVVYHEPAARYFAQDWPRFHFLDYLSATTPGYHLLLAAVIRLVSDTTLALQITGALIAAALAAVVGHACGRSAPWRLALLLAAAVVASPYVVASAAWTLPDNLGWLGVAAIFSLLLAAELTALRLILAGLVLALLVCVRQSHLWAAGAIFAAAWMVPSPPGGVIRSLVFRWPKRVRWALLAIACAIPAAALLAWFYRLWDGLTPPRFAAQHRGFNWACPAFVLAILGGVSAAFFPWLWQPAVETWRRGRGWLIFAIIVGFAAARVPPTTYSLEAGRYSGLWNIARALPVDGQTSWLIVGLAILGALATVVWVRALPQRQGVVFLATLAAFTAAQTANHHCWQRYVEPFVLILTVMSGAILARSPAAVRRAWLWPALLVACLAASAIAGLRPFPRVEDYRESYRALMTPPQGGWYNPPDGRHPPQVIRPADPP
jgi:hypothetical protein